VTGPATGHVLDDLLRPDLRVVFCGTQAGRASAERRAYYAGRGNRFWSTLFEVELTPALLRPERYADLLEHGIGLTDVAKATSGPDADLRRLHFDVDGFRRKISLNQPRFVAFNGKRSASVALEIPAPKLAYGAQAATIGGASVFVLPSTSGAAAAFWDRRPWAELALRALAQS